MAQPNYNMQGLIFGSIAVIAFGLTLPITRYVSAELSPLMIGLGRAALAGIVAAIILYQYKAPIPQAHHRFPLAMVILGVIFGFPVFSAWAMQLVPASHGGVVLGILPLMTAIVGSWVSQEKPSLWFWLFSIIGAGLVMTYLWPDDKLTFHTGDILLLIASFAAALGYAYGGQLTQQLPSWQVICWALVFALPITLPILIWQWPDAPSASPIKLWGGFLYLAFISQLFGFFLWYRALAIGGIAKISQLQLLQPFVTLIVSWVFLAEVFEAEALIYATLIIITVFLAQKARVKS